MPSSLVGFEEFVSITGGRAELVQEAIELGWLAPGRSATEELLFNAVHIYKVRKLIRICQDFDIPTTAGIIIVDLLQRVDELEARVRELGGKMNSERSQE
ncbi:MAG: MerR family transcriptional regulator [Desulfovibrionaceae bacterium]|nr:MerR family transcriptional regulator [Desulfovibrionaceae bacterium]